MSGSSTLLNVSDLSKHYDTGAGEVPVLDGVTFEMPAGDSLAIVGPSGSGKSTLLQIVGTLDQPSRGRVELNGRHLGSLMPAQLAQVRNREIGFVFQSHYLLPQCTAWENILIPTLAGVTASPAAGKPPDETVEQRAQRLLKRVGLEDRSAHFPGQLSGGERQRVAVVRALINQPKLLLADEPTGALDEASAEALAQLLVELNEEETVTLIVVTHAMPLAERMKRILRLKRGKLVSEQG
jgi:ABC-type lipoprotein export system ATPase subunit